MLFATLVVSLIAAALALLLVVAERRISAYGDCTIDINDGTKVMTVKGGRSLLGALTDQKLFVPSACGGRGTCGYCKVAVREGGGPVLPTEEPFLSAQERRDNVRLSCQCKVRANLKIRVPDHLLAVREFTCTVAGIRDLTGDMKEFRCALNEVGGIRFVPGQYVQLLAPAYGKSTEEVYRAYSISSDPRDTDAIELVIRRVPGGICTTYCFDYLKVGDTVRLNGPYGEFCLSATQAPMVMIAGGSGIAPIKCLLHQMANEKIDREARFFFGANMEADLCYRELMAKFGQALPRFTFTPIVARDPAWKGESGLVTAAVDRAYQDLSGHEAYLCGSPGMIDASVKVLTAHGMPERAIFYDKFS